MMALPRRTLGTQRSLARLLKILSLSASSALSAVKMSPLLRSATVLVAVCVGPLALHGQEQGVRMDFQDVELRLVLSALADAGNLNIVYGDLPAKRVTLRMSQPVPRDQVPALLRSVAASNGLKVIEEDGLLRIEAAPTAVTGTQRSDSGAGVPELQLYVYRLRHARARRPPCRPCSVGAQQDLPVHRRPTHR